MIKKRPLPILASILKKIAPKIGARVFIEPIWQVVGQITFKSGKNSYFRYNTLNLNPMGSSEISRDKDYSNLFMAKMGYPIVPGSKTFFSDNWADVIGSPDRKIDAAYTHAKKIGLPVIVKPNSGSQGVGVSMVHNKKEFCIAVRGIFRHDKIVLVQKPVQGKDYRVVVLDKKVISAYERIPLNIVGDGKSSILRLLETRQIKFNKSGRDTHIKTTDPRIVTKLAHQGLKLSSIPNKGQRIFLLDNANLSTGGDSIDVTDRVHPRFKAIAAKLTHDMGLRLCGVDLMIEGDISENPKKYWVLEINSAPGLDHYAKIGKSQERIVEDLYLEVLRHMEK
jgi:D-alanine-D-alanine ligase-like ATP-grasp enzyme